MISKLIINDSKNLPIKWWNKSESLKDIKEISFNPGLNILFGRNGSGKSSILKLLGKMFHAEAGNFSCITEHSVRELIPINFSAKGKEDLTDNLFKSCYIEHDSQGIMFLDPDHTVGLFGKGAAFDDDFFSEGVASLFTKGSSGQLGFHKLAKILDAMKKGDKINPVFKSKYMMEKPSKDVMYVIDFLKGNIPDGQPTFLLDEPDRSLDIDFQIKIWNFLKKMSEKVQIIVASHSPFCLSINNANYIEFSKNYLENCRVITSTTLAPFGLSYRKKDK